MILLEYSKDNIEEKFVLDGVAEELLERPIQARFGQKLLGMVISQGDFTSEAKHLYIYDLEDQRYKGFIDFSALTFGESK